MNLPPRSVALETQALGQPPGIATRPRRGHKGAVSSPPVIISLHLPKAAGSSMRVSLERQFGERALFDYGRGPLGPDIDLIEPSLAPGIALVHGHFRPARYEAAAPDAFWFTFLRDPVDRLISMYFFWQTLPFQGQALHRRFLDEQPDIETFATYPLIQTFISETFFAGHDMSRFDFIGFHETRAQDMVRLNVLAGLELDPEVYDNRTRSGDSPRAQLLADSQRMARLRALLVDDIRFYDRQREARGA